jgi:glycosyltransferase involved in cell wall biosynthesis
MNKCICIATTKTGEQITEGDLPPDYHRTAKLLSKNGWDVVVLIGGTENIERVAEKYKNIYGISVFSVHKLCKESDTSSLGFLDNADCRNSESLRLQMNSILFHEALQILINKNNYRFDVIEFSDQQGIGFIPIRMNKNLKSYKRSTIVLKLQRPRIWIKEISEIYPNFEDVKIDYMERYAFENADLRISSNEGLLKWVEFRGWKHENDLGILDNEFSDNKQGDNEESFEIDNSNRVLDLYGSMMQTREKRAGHDGEYDQELPRATIIIPTRDITTSVYLEKTLSALANQSYKNTKILISDGSVDPEAIFALNQIEKKYPQISIIRGEPNGIAKALNQALQLVDSKYVIEVDADNLPMSDMVETFVRCMENRSDVAALSCYNIVFRDEEGNKLEEYLSNQSGSAYMTDRCNRPLGPCLPSLFFENAQGDANSIFLSEALRSIGGWPEDNRGAQDWELWLKLLANGFEMDVIPKYLYYYRDRLNSECKKLDVYHVDEADINIISSIIKNRPEYFSRYCYGDMHRLMRSFIIDSSRLQNENLAAFDELNSIKEGALYVLGKRLGSMAARSRNLEKIFQFMGYILKELLE